MYEIFEKLLMERGVTAYKVAKGNRHFYRIDDRLEKRQKCAKSRQASKNR